MNRLTVQLGLAGKELEAIDDQVKHDHGRVDALLASLSDGILVRNRDLYITKINPAFTNMLGYTETELMGKRLTDIIKIKHLDGAPVISSKAIGIKVLEQGQTVNGNYLWFKKDGSQLAVNVATSPYRIDGHPAGLITVVRDVSEQAAIDKAKTEFVSLAAHQLRTPLASVNWYLEMLGNDQDGQLSEAQKDYLSEIVVASQRMVRLVNDLLNVSHIDLGTFAIEPVPTDIERVIRTVLGELGSQIAKKSLHITTAFSGPVDSYKIDPQLAHIVFQNLIGNAVKYTPAGGSIDIYAILDSQKLLITIDDTGYGIPKDQQKQVFNKLFRADNVIKLDTEGTGLGLYLVKAIVDRSGGNIDFVSRLNHGSTFTVTFPCSGTKRQTSVRELATHHKQRT